MKKVLVMLALVAFGGVSGVKAMGVDPEQIKDGLTFLKEHDEEIKQGVLTGLNLIGYSDEDGELTASDIPEILKALKKKIKKIQKILSPITQKIGLKKKKEVSEKSEASEAPELASVSSSSARGILPAGAKEKFKDLRFGELQGLIKDVVKILKKLARSHKSDDTNYQEELKKIIPTAKGEEFEMFLEDLTNLGKQQGTLAQLTEGRAGLGVEPEAIQNALVISLDILNKTLLVLDVAEANTPPGFFGSTRNMIIGGVTAVGLMLGFGNYLGYWTCPEGISQYCLK